MAICNSYGLAVIKAGRINATRQASKKAIKPASKLQECK